MPNNKKNKKNKENNTARATAAAATAAVAPTVAAEQRLLFCGCHNPASCDKCLLSYPPGCLHSLRQDERMSAEMNELLPVYNRLFAKKDATFWEHPENSPFANERMLRFFFYQSVKCIVGKNHRHGDYKGFAKTKFFFFLHLYGVIKCGSEAALEMAYESNDVASLDQGQVSFRALYLAFDGYDKCYYRLVYILNELSPCNCLEAEVKRAKEEDKSLPLRCSNDDCDKEEASSENHDKFSRCAGCKMAHYCSRHCYKDHWRGHTMSAISWLESSHKVACGAIQELKSILAGGGDGGGDGGSRGAKVSDSSA